MEIKDFISRNNIQMTRIGKYNWEKHIEHDGTIVYLLTAGGFDQDTITFLYGKGVLSIRNFESLHGADGSKFFFKCEIDDLEKYVNQLKQGHKIKIAWLYKHNPFKIEKTL